jgi:hypothetical protein
MLGQEWIREFSVCGGGNAGQYSGFYVVSHQVFHIYDNSETKWFRYLDSTVISFLQRMQPLLHDKVNFDVHNFGGSEQSFEAMSTALDHLIPLLNGGIETFSLAYTDLLLYIRDHFPAQLFGVKLLDVWFGFAKPTAELTESLLEWLVTQRQDSQPRMLMLRAYEYAAWVIEFIERIRQVDICNIF